MKNYTHSNVLITMVTFVALGISSCTNPLVVTKENSDRQVAVVNSLTVKLIPGITLSDMGLSTEDRESRLLSSAEKSLGRAIDSTVEILVVPESEVTEVIQAAVDSAAIPDFDAFDQSDLDTIRADFPGLSDEEISENIDAIRLIYLDQLSAHTLKEICKSLESPKVARTLRAATSDGTLSFGTSDITVFELAVMTMYPFSALRLNDTREKAFSLVESYLHCEPDLTNEKSDAFRHSVWSQTLAKMGSGLRGEKIAWATLFSAAHELGTKYDSTGRFSSEMDWHNNTVGMEYYSANSKKKYTKFLWLKWESGVDEPSYSELANAMKPKALSATFVDNRVGTDAEGHSLIRSQAGKLVYIKADSKVYY